MEQAQRKNFTLLSLQNFLFRAGWLFKTESVIIPAAARALGASNFLIGLFPMLSRFGETLPALFAARHVQPFPRKKPFLLAAALVYFLAWFTAGLLFLFVPLERRGLLLLLFMFLYVCFWINIGVYGNVYSLVMAKVIPARYRGRLVSAAGVSGGVASVILTFTVVQGILEHPFQNPLRPYALLFFCAALLFLAGFIVLLFVSEPAGPGRGEKRPPLIPFIRHSFRLVAKDRNFMRFFAISSLLMLAFGLLMFYTAYAKNHLKVPDYYLAYYLGAQAASNSLGALYYGWLADRKGNRRALERICLFVSLTPVAAVLAGVLPGLPSRGLAYCVVYLLVGFNLPAYQILVNYLLETIPEEFRENYLGIYAAMSSLFFFLPLIVGFLLDRFYYHKVFIVLGVVIGASYFLAKKLVEPRHAAERAEPGPEIGLG